MVSSFSSSTVIIIAKIHLALEFITIFPHRFHMAKGCLAELLTLGVIVALCTSCSATLYHILPTAGTTDDCPAQPCHNLSYYVQNVSHYFISNTTIKFLPGLHEVAASDGFIVISNASNITLTGNMSRLVCTAPTVFVFTNVSNILMENLSFFYCGHPIGQYSNDEIVTSSPETHAALLLLHIHSLHLFNVSVENSTGYGLLGVNVLGESLISDSMFSFNNYHTIDYLKHCEVLLLDGNYLCQGGNAMFIYFDPVECTRDRQTYSMTIVNSAFSFGVGLHGSAPESVVADVWLNGGGINVILCQASYGINFTMDNVITTRNVATIGANLYFRVCGSVSHSQIRIIRSSSSKGRSLYEGEELVKGPGLAYFHGLHYSLSQRRCELGLHTEETEEYMNVLDIRESTFFENAASGCGTCFILGYGFGLYAIVENCTFINNRGVFGAAAYIKKIIDDANRVENNSKNNYEIIWRYTSFIENHVVFNDSRMEIIESSSYMYILSTFFVTDVDTIVIDGCRFIDNNLTGMLIMRSKVKIQGDMILSGNRGQLGGGVALYDHAFMYFASHTHLYFINNHAKRGGGIYVHPKFSFDSLCFFQTESTDYADIQVVLEDNHAEEAGDALYGGFVDVCHSYTDPTLFDNLFKVVGNSTSEISSAPQGACLCLQNIPKCNTSENIKPVRVYFVHTYPGGTFEISLVLVGQRHGTAPGVVKAEFIEGHGHLAPLQEMQETPGKCTNLTYTLFSKEDKAVLYLYPRITDEEYIGVGNLLEDILVEVILLPCPPGFELSNHSGQCVCTLMLRERDVNCNISAERPLIQRAGSLWINLSLSGDDVIVHDHCPFDYCKHTSIWLDLDDPDEQCAFGHSGIMCGGCKPKLSLALGSSHCLHCSNINLYLLAILALAGLVLVVLLILCNLTVSVGTINGLVFYANIVRVNHSVFFAQEKSIAPVIKTILSVVIAWLNLDLGTEVCLYDGMDAYVHTWLQFAFPFYIWTIVGLIIILSRYSSTVVKLVGTNAVPVLGTMFLLSYAKLQRAIITTFSFTYINNYFTDGSSLAIWLYDGNVPFLQGKHIALFTMALAVTLLFILPFTLLVLLAPCIQAWSNHMPLQWIHIRFKPLLDAYQAPFKDKFRYWAGLMLVVRNILFIIFAFNTLGDPNINLAVTATAMLPLLMFSLAVHKTNSLNVLETSFLLNLAILAGWTLYSRADPAASQTALVCTSTGIAFITFICILLYHTHQRFTQSRMMQDCFRKRDVQLPAAAAEVEMEALEDSEANIIPAAPTMTVVDLREPLLTDN